MAPIAKPILTAPISTKIVEEAKVPESVPEPVEAEVIVRYNHYKKPFKTLDNVLNWDTIDE